MFGSVLNTPLKGRHALVFYKIGVYRNFTKFTGKHFIKKKTPAQVFSCGFCCGFYCGFLRTRFS